MSRWAWGPLLALACAGMSVAHDAPAQAPARADVPVAAAPLRDAEFGVDTRQFGLKRRVEMYQWQRTGNDGFRKVWSDRPIASADHPEGRRNPGAFALQTRYWIARDVRLRGRPLDEDVLKALGEWRPFRPAFSALPGNLSATFQPEGDGLVSAENPLDPQVGDLRVTWHEMRLPPLTGYVALRDGAWRLREDALAQRASGRNDAGDAGTGPVDASWVDRVGRGTLLIGAGILVVLFTAWVLRRRKADRRRGAHARGSS
jgi:hypothetical protein